MLILYHGRHVCSESVCRDSVGAVNTSGGKKLVKKMLRSLTDGVHVTNIKTALRNVNAERGLAEDALFISAVIIGSISPAI